MTASVWFEDLEQYPAERVLRAIRRCRRDQSFRPQPADILDAMLANSHDWAAEPSDRLAIEARDPDPPGVPPPAAFKLLLRNLLAKRIPDAPEQLAGRSRDQQLAGLEAMVDQDAAEAGEQ